MDTYHWNKITNNSTTTNGIYFKSTSHIKMQEHSCHHIPHRQEHCKNKYLRNKSIFNQIIHIQEVGGEIFSITTKPSTPYNIGNFL